MNYTILGLLFNAKQNGNKLNGTSQTAKIPNGFANLLERIFQGTQQLIHRLSGSRKAEINTGAPIPRPAADTLSRNQDYTPPSLNLMQSHPEKYVSIPSQPIISTTAEPMDLSSVSVKLAKNRSSQTAPENSFTGILKSVPEIFPSAAVGALNPLPEIQPAIISSPINERASVNPSLSASLPSTSGANPSWNGMEMSNPGQLNEDLNVTPIAQIKPLPNDFLEPQTSEKNEITSGQTQRNSNVQMAFEVASPIPKEENTTQTIKHIITPTVSTPLTAKEHGESPDTAEIESPGKITESQIKIANTTAEADQTDFIVSGPEVHVSAKEKESYGQVFITNRNSTNIGNGIATRSETVQLGRDGTHVIDGEGSDSSKSETQVKTTNPVSTIERVSITQQLNALFQESADNKPAGRIGPKISTAGIDKSSGDITDNPKGANRDYSGTQPVVKTDIAEQTTDSPITTAKSYIRVKKEPQIVSEEQPISNRIATAKEELVKDAGSQRNTKVGLRAVQTNKPGSAIQGGNHNTMKEGVKSINSLQQSERFDSKTTKTAESVPLTTETASVAGRLRTMDEPVPNQRLTNSPVPGDKPKSDHSSNSTQNHQHNSFDSPSSLSHRMTLQNVKDQDFIASKGEEKTDFESTLATESNKWSEKVAGELDAKVSSTPQLQPPLQAMDKAFRLALINRVTQLIEQSQHKNKQELTLRLQTGTKETIEVHFTREASTNRGKILINSEYLAELLQRQLPTIVQNLENKGIHFADLSVQLNNKGPNANPQRQASQHLENKGLTDRETEEVTNTTKARRIYYYGYNTIDYVA